MPRPVPPLLSDPVPDMTTDPAATLLESRTAFRGHVFRVEVERVRLTDGREVELDIVRHGPSVVIVPMVDASHVVLIRQYRHAVGEWLWEVPAGSIDRGETPEEAAIRECHEETGLRPARVVALGTFLATPGYCDERMLFFRAEGLHDPGAVAARDPDEVIQPCTVPLAEARAMVARGEIRDLKSALALLLAS